ncbi:MAG: glycosyltransferase family 9 protein [Nitrospirae bacterium]|nr:glycosyltransferase family 9 protein [Nitrospirota bacterium]
MKEILIINLTRMGDLLQTTPVMAGLKEAYPEARITLVANSSFTEICRGIPMIDELIVFDMKDQRIKLSQRKISLAGGFRYLEALIEKINGREYDLTLNFTHSPVSALLTSMVRSREIRGITADREGHKLIKHPWMRYFFNVVPNREYNPFHLVDMYLKAVGIYPRSRKLFYQAPEEDASRSAELLRGKGVADDDLLIGIHLGASKGDKRWPSACFAKLADLIVREFGAKIVLFGSPEEAALAGEFEAGVRFETLNFVGGTNLGELSALLRRCSLLISNDTGPLHLATAVGTAVIDIFTANVHYLETGPYGEGHHVVQADLPCVPCDFHVQCNNMICKDVIKPEAVFEVAKRALGRGPGPGASDEGLWINVRVYESHFRNDGQIAYSPLLRRPLKKEELYRILYSKVWNTGFAKDDMNVETAYGDISGELSSFYGLENCHEMADGLIKDGGAIEQLAALTGEGLGLVRAIAEEASEVSFDVRKIRDIWEKVEAVDERIELIAYANPCLRPLVLIFTYSKEAMEGKELLELAEASCRIYEELLFTSTHMLKLMKRLVPFFEAMEEQKSLTGAVTGAWSGGPAVTGLRMSGTRIREADRPEPAGGT